MMENKNLIIIAAIIAVIIIVAGVIFATGLFNSTSGGKTTSFSNAFMEGEFTGDVKLANNSSAYMQSYKDSEHSVTYNISTVDNSTALMDYYYLQGIQNPEKRTFNGNEWNIYFSKAVENGTNKTLNIVICQSQGEKQGYLIYMIIGAESNINVSSSTFEEPYKSYIEPLLKSVTLKESKNVPAIYDEFGLTKEEFYKQIGLIHQYKSGNVSAISGGN